MKITGPHVAAARLLMSAGGSMQASAIALGIRSVDLDQALWAHLSTPTQELLAPKRKRRHRPDF